MIGQPKHPDDEAVEGLDEGWKLLAQALPKIKKAVFAVRSHQAMEANDLIARLTLVKSQVAELREKIHADRVAAR